LGTTSAFAFRSRETKKEMFMGDSDWNGTGNGIVGTRNEPSVTTKCNEFLDQLRKD
jgi:hypothetical protein